MTDWTDFFNIVFFTLAIDAIILLTGWGLYSLSRDARKENAKSWLLGAAIIVTPITICGFLFAILAGIGAM